MINIPEVEEVKFKCRACEIEKNDEQVKQMPAHICNKIPEGDIFKRILKRGTDIALLESYSKFLMKHGYLDTD